MYECCIIHYSYVMDNLHFYKWNVALRLKIACTCLWLKCTLYRDYNVMHAAQALM